MSRFNRTVATVLVAVGLAAAAIGQSALAQQQGQVAPQSSQPADQPTPELKQIALTEKQIQGLLDSQPEMDELLSKLPDNPARPPDAAVMAQLEAVAKKHGFADYAEYGTVAGNVDMLLDGFDGQTKKFIGFEAVVKKEIAQVEADSKMPAKEKKEAMDELNDELKNVPTVQYPANIELVTKYFDQLNDALRSEE